MTGLRGVTRRLSGLGLTGGPARSAVLLVLLLLLWSNYQLGGLNANVLDSYLVLSLPLAIAAIGTTLVLITGHFDLSAAGVVTVTNVIASLAMNNTNPWLVAVLLLAMGALIGAVNGFLVVVGRMQSIAVTLATFIMLSGVSLVLLNVPGGSVPSTLTDVLTAPLGGSSRALFIFIVLGVAWLLFRRTRLGIHMLAVGADEDAARLSGVSVRAVRIKTYAIAGLCYALSGLFISAVTSTGDPRAANSYLLATFAAVALGGASFAGGNGSVIGTLFGALILIALPKVLFVMGAEDYLAIVLQGLIILVAVLISAVAARRQANYVPPVAASPVVAGS